MTSYNMISVKPDQEEGYSTCSLSVHSKTAFVSIPALLMLLVMSAVLLERNQSDLKELDNIAPQYISLASDVVEKLQEEKSLILLQMTSHETALQSELKKTNEQVDLSVKSLAQYHFAKGNGEDTSDIKHLGRFTNVLQHLDLQEIRSLGSRSDAGSMKKAIEKYDRVCTDLIILAGRQTTSILHEYQTLRISMFGSILKVASAARAQLAVAWSANTSGTHDSTLALIHARSFLKMTDTMYRVYASQKALKETDPLEESPIMNNIHKYLEAASNVVRRNHQNTSEIVTSCRQQVQAAYTDVRSYYPTIDDETSDRMTDLEATMICLCILIVVCVWAVCIHLGNIVSYKNSLHQVRAAAKEIEKLRKSIVRMQDYTDTFHVHMNNEIPQGKQKGVPSAEKVLMGTLPKVRAMRKFLPDTIFAERFQNAEGQPYTQLDMKALKDVTILICNLGQLNLVAPQEEVPVKQKTLETAMNIYISAIDQIAEEQGGVIMDVTSDYITICWNLVEKSGRCEESACKAALDIAELKSEGGKPSMGIVTEALVAGNVGIPTLKKFVFLGKCLPLCRHMDKLARYYGLGCLIDAATAEAVAGEPNFTVRAVDVVTLMMGGSKDGAVLFELSGKTVSNKNEQQLQHWTQLFSYYQNGDLKTAQEEIQTYIKKYGSTNLSKRFLSLLEEYPILPPRNIYDFLP